MTFTFNTKPFIINVLWIYIFWTIAHFICPHLYIWLCVPATIYGFILSPFIAPAPHCQALRWAIYQGGNTIVAMWILFGSWCMQLLIIPYNKDTDSMT